MVAVEKAICPSSMTVRAALKSLRENEVFPMLRKNCG